MVEMSLNIKNAAPHRLIQELASLTGETMTGAVTEAVRERLERVRRERSDGLAERLLAIGRNCAARLNEPYRSAEHGDLLYGEDGMPQ
jgi:antitoxin VapB